jgi:hypothetical protein
MIDLGRFVLLRSQPALGATSIGSYYFLASQTLLMLVCTANRELFLIFLLLGLAFPRLFREGAFWLVVAMPQVAALVFRWGHMDNHQYLFAYWCFALAFATAAPAPLHRQCLAFNARMLIGMSMTMAVIWKLISADYIDGSFFTYSLLTDDRFASVASWIGGLSSDTLVENREAIGALQSSYLNDDKLKSVVLQSTSMVDVLAQMLTIWTLLIEVTIAVAFLAPTTRTTELCRNIALPTFIVTTYLVAPVIGFGWILTLMGIAQCPSTNRRFWSLIYLLSFVLSCMMRLLFEGVVGIIVN